MNKRIKDAFDQIHAEEKLISQTREYLEAQRQNEERTRRRRYRYVLAMAASFLFLAVSAVSLSLFFTTTATISVDVNPSLELHINRFDRVLSVTGYNADGQELADSLHVRFLNYEDAVEQVLASSQISELLNSDAFLEVTVAGSDDGQCGQILASMETATAHHANSHCGTATQEEVTEAHDAGLSFGKYRAFLELQALDPDITMEDVQDMTMREIRELIQSLGGQTDTGTESETEEETEEDGGSGHHGEGNGEHGHHGWDESSE